MTTTPPLACMSLEHAFHDHSVLWDMEKTAVSLSDIGQRYDRSGVTSSLESHVRSTLEEDEDLDFFIFFSSC